MHRVVGKLSVRRGIADPAMARVNQRTFTATAGAMTLAVIDFCFSGKLKCRSTGALAASGVMAVG